MGVALKSILAERGDEVYITSRSRHQDEANIHYLRGDAHDENFLSDILKDRYDAIVDFMIYRSEEFGKKAGKLLNATEQYIFTSSSRVYADSDVPITEETPRLLDVCKDSVYLKTDEYALAKAREENVLFDGNQKNWTIIRPYITYNVERLQLGAIEKDLWLYRAWHGRSIPLPKDVAVHQTTMTYGGDVALAIAGLIGNKKAFGEAFHLTGTEHMAWSAVLDIYLKVLENETGRKQKVYMPEDSMELSTEMNNTTQVVYDRLYDRVFDNTKLLSVVGNMEFVSMEEGLSQCLSEFLKNPRWRNGANAKFEAYLGKKLGEKIEISELEDREKLKYLLWYYIPDVMKLLKKIKVK
jgi:nucleoside-diphosphate-sugar epimerase